MTHIRIRLFAYLFIIFLLSFSALFVITSYFITQEYASFERNLEIDKALQLQKGVKNSLDTLTSTGRDWSIWDDAYTFMKSHNKKFIESNLTVDTVCNMDINFIIFVDLDGHIITDKGCDLNTHKELFLPSNFTYHIAKERLLINHSNVKHIYEGLIDSASGPLMVSAQPIIKTDGSGPIEGTLIVARFFTRDILHTYAAPGVTITLQESSTQQYGEISVKTPTDREIITSFDVSDIYNNPLVRVNSRSIRIIYAKRILAYQYVFISLFSGGFLLLLGQYLTTEFLITKKITALIQAVGHISKNENLQNINLPIISHDKDEFTILQSSINKMIQSIGELTSHISLEHQKAQQYINVMDTIVRVLDKNNIIHLINDKGLTILGYKKEELIGKNWVDLIVPVENRTSLSNLLSSFILSPQRNKDTLENESEIITKSGQRRRIQWHHSRIDAQNEEGPLLISSGFDMTEELDTQKQLEQRMRELEQMNKMMINRELTMIELKKKIKQYET